VQCAIGDALAGSSLHQQLTARADPTDQSLLYPVGTCIGAAPNVGYQTIDCSAPHQVEITGAIDLSGRVDHAPTYDEVNALAHDDCSAAAQTFLGRPLDGNLTEGQLQLAPESWNAGSHHINCLIARRSEGQTFDTLTAPIRNGG
jgi:hypothetical protein